MRVHEDVAVANEMPPRRSDDFERALDVAGLSPGEHETLVRALRSGQLMSFSLTRAETLSYSVVKPTRAPEGWLPRARRRGKRTLRLEFTTWE